MSDFFSEALGKHDRANFDSGNARLDDYFRKVVSQDVKRHYATCRVLVEKQSGLIAGFYTLSATHVSLDEIPDELARKLPRYPYVPAILIGWLARDLKFRQREIGAILLYDAIAQAIKPQLGAWAICADAIDEHAAEFYLKHGFLRLSKKTNTLFIPVARAKTLVEVG